MVRKRVWHCNHCGSSCEVYKKGKKHRVIVCPRHGIIAANPGMLGGAIELASSFIPIPGAAMVGKVAGKMLGGGKKTDAAQIERDAMPRYQIPRATVVRQPVLVDID